MIVVSARLGASGAVALMELLETAEVGIEPADAELAEIAYQAWLRFGKGRHGASLNFGDCFAYALAMQRGEPLLFKGDDFERTDVAR